MICTMFVYCCRKVSVNEAATEETDEDDEMAMIGQHCHSYVRRVMHSSIKTLPKAIILKSVISSKQQLITSFYDTLGGFNDCYDLEKILAEDPQMMEKREKLNKQLELMQAAKQEISSAGYA